MSKKAPNTAANALREIEETGDRVAAWAAEHAALILGAIAAVLMIAAAAGLYVQHGTNARDEAANALALVTSQYRQAMGADPTGGPIVEPANPELAERTRTDYTERFIAVANKHAGTAAGAIAWLEAGSLQAELGRTDDAIGSFSAARNAAGDLAISAIASTRLAGLAEDRGDPEAAAKEYEAAAAIVASPIRAESLTEAVRCWVEADNPDRALELYQRIEAEHPGEVVAPQIESLVAELRLGR